jgi:sugar lactone lactonase YvrE
MPQDIRASPDGKLFYVADMMADGVHVVDGEH